MDKKILHIDMNKFYATVEQMLNPSLKGKAIAVCGSTEERHGIVLTASAEAKSCVRKPWHRRMISTHTVHR